MKEFESDGCSGGISWIWNKVTGHEPPWEGCCIAHDKGYWAGGTRADRKEVDKALRKCVKSKGYPKTAWIMYIAVRIFGGPRWPTTYRWGFGCKYSPIRGYKQWQDSSRFIP